MDRVVHSTMATFYMKANGKAMGYIKKSEPLTNRDTRSYRVLITMYTRSENTSEERSQRVENGIENQQCKATKDTN